MCISRLSLIGNLHPDTFEGLINFVKRQLYCREVLFPLREYQKVSFNLFPLPEIQGLLHSSIYTPRTESDLWAFSLLREADDTPDECTHLPGERDKERTKGKQKD